MARDIEEDNLVIPHPDVAETLNGWGRWVSIGILLGCAPK
jgi:hypothetical protein